MNGASNNTIGGNITGAGNVVSGNLTDGITVSGLDERVKALEEAPGAAQSG